MTHPHDECYGLFVSAPGNVPDGNPVLVARRIGGAQVGELNGEITVD